MNRLHRGIQEQIAAQIGNERVEIEASLPGHYADVYWPERKIIFEIQCSPISLSEVLQRNHDYEALGLRVVWILHTKTFNKRRLTPTERYLRTRNAYYTNILPNQTGLIFDQEEIIQGSLRLYRSSPRPIDLTLPSNLSFFTTWLRKCELDALWHTGGRALCFPGDRFYRRFYHHWRDTLAFWKLTYQIAPPTFSLFKQYLFHIFCALNGSKLSRIAPEEQKIEKNT